MTPRYALPFLLPLLLFAPARAFAGEPSFSTAQLYNQPPPIDDPYESRAPTQPRDATGLELRVDRLERELRLMTGRVEELQHSVQLLEDQLRAARLETARAAPPASAPAGERRGDAFDPMNSPGAVGAPRPIGQTPPSAPLAAPPHVAAATPTHDYGAPLDVTPPALKGQTAPPAVAPPVPTTGAILPSDAATAQPPRTDKDDYDEAVAMMRTGQYEAAEKSLSVFLAKHPKSKFAPAATYGLGESFFMRGRNREAAEKYLEISTKYAQTAQAPDALLRLGQSLAALGAREQACASFSEVGAKYPGSPARIREAAQRESKKLQC